MKTILIIEDDFNIQLGLKDQFEKEGFRVIAETDGNRGYQRAKTANPDLILLDIMLPMMDGLQLCSKLKKEGIDAPIFLLTSLAQEQTRLHGLEYGADDYITKPFSIRELVLRVRNAINRANQQSVQKNFLNDDVRQARAIQIASLPANAPQSKYLTIYGSMSPARIVGGDYYDYLNFADGRMGIIVADVSGKGMPAAMHVQKMQGVVQSSLTMICSASDMLKQLQKHLKESLGIQKFVTAVVAFFDMKEATVEIAEAGHLPVLHKRSGRIYSIKPKGVWISKSSEKIFDAALETRKIRLRRGDRFLFYSDGVLEAKNTANNEYGLHRLKQMFRKARKNPCKNVESYFKQIQQFSGEQPQEDDITIVEVAV
jgi:sigma-B regulation protein RsbU (phosphoserine phosphatase)